MPRSDPRNRPLPDQPAVSRRTFVARAGGIVAATGATVAASGPFAHAQPKYRWRMATAWSTGTPVLAESARRFAEIVEELSGGRLTIEVFASGELVPTPGLLDACSKGTIEAFNAASFFWADRDPSLWWFAGVPFGLNAQGAAAWHYEGGGEALWEAAYAPYALVPRLGGSSDAQSGGWFRKPIDTIADFKGLKVRYSWLAKKVAARAGATVVPIYGPGYYEALSQGRIDALELLGPQLDMRYGLHKAAPFFYYPSWQEPSAGSEFTFNKQAYEALPADIRRILDHAAVVIQKQHTIENLFENAAAFRRLRTEFERQVEIRQFPAGVLQALKKIATEVAREEAEKTPMARKVYASYTQFQRLIDDWNGLSEGAYHAHVAPRGRG